MKPILALLIATLVVAETTMISSLKFEPKLDTLNILCVDGYKYLFITGYNHEIIITQMYEKGIKANNYSTQPIECK